MQQFSHPNTVKKESSIPDYLAENLVILFVGINPGKYSISHHYAGPTNKFWKVLYEAGLVDKQLSFADDSSLVFDYNYGLANLIRRRTRGIQDLRPDEFKAAIPDLLWKLERYQPKIVCLIGICIYDSMRWFLK